MINPENRFWEASAALPLLEKQLDLQSGADLICDKPGEPLPGSERRTFAP
ncbi:hypothetical protein ASZ90_015338 [hydrocarbon metagenome]|uniref:Uncharacterized protein n=1 Tax=hydrocarbon metagenome TaxID=938273 RepID=A0A0W8F367_9ZZZZ